MDIIRDFGYLFVFFGTFVNGETTLIMAGALVQEGSLVFPKVLAISVSASYMGHISFYLLGYLGGDLYLRKSLRFKEKVLKMSAFIRRYETLGIFLCQYILGLRLASAMAFGLARVSPLKYGGLQLLSCLIWASLFLILGYVFGYSVEPYIQDIEKGLLVVLSAGLFLIWGVKRVFAFYFKGRF